MTTVILGIIVRNYGTTVGSRGTAEGDGGLQGVGGGAHVFELGHGEIAAEQAKTAIRSRDQAFGVNMIERLG